MVTELSIEDLRKRDSAQIKTWVNAFLSEIGLQSLNAYLNESDFYTAPGSTRFHDNIPGGLASHSVATGWMLARLATSLKVPNKVILNDIGVSLPIEQVSYLLGIIHDLCKVDMYVTDYRNVKQKDGTWTKEPYYRVSDNYVSLGHGIESWHRFYQLISGSEGSDQYLTLMYPVVYHMGSTDLAPMQEPSYAKICCMDPWVDLLHMADKLAADHLEAIWLK